LDYAGQLDTRPAVRGTVRINGDTTVFTIGGGDSCTLGDEWAWQASLPEIGLLHVVLGKEASGNCRVARGTEWTLIRLSPSSPSLAQVAAADTAD
jgi:hypothetical protein